MPVDPSLVGKELPDVSFPIERSKVMEMARSLFDDDPAYAEPGAPAPLTVSALAAHWRPEGAEGMAVSLGMDLKRVLHGESTWDYLAPIKAGDELVGKRRIADVSTREGKRGGTMTLVTVEITYTNQDGVEVMRQRDVVVETGA